MGCRARPWGRAPLAVLGMAAGLVLAPRAGWAEAPAAPLTLKALAGSPSRLTLSGSFRLRYEGLDGQPRAGPSPSTHLYLLRTNIEAEYDAGGGVRLGAELQDARAYGATPRTGLSSNEVDTFELLQAYVSVPVTTPLGRGTVQAGRLVMAPGSRRLVSGGDDRNAATGYTGLKLDTKTAGGWTTTLILVSPDIRLPEDQSGVLHNRVAFDRESFDLLLWGGFVGQAKLFGRTGVDLAFVGLDERDSPGRPTRDRRLRTASARLIRPPAPGQAFYEAEAGYQFGSIAASLQPGAARIGVAAYFLHFDAGYQVEGPARVRLSAQYDLASGDDGKGRFGRFDSLYGMRRGDFAPGGLYSALGRSNISSPGLRVEAAPGQRTELLASYRALWLASAQDAFSTTGVRDSTEHAGTFAGQQLEARLRYWLAPERLRLEADGVVLIKGRFLREAPNAPHTGAARFLQLSLTASF